MMSINTHIEQSRRVGSPIPSGISISYLNPDDVPASQLKHRLADSAITSTSLLDEMAAKYSG